MKHKALLSNYLARASQLASKYKTLLSNYRATVSQLASLVLPILAAHQIGALISFSNTTLAGRQDPLWVAATGLANNAFSAVMGLGWGIITSVGILTASQLGKTEDIAKTGLILKASLLTTFGISIPIMILLKYMQPIWLFFGQSLEVAHLGQAYLNGLLWVVFVDFAKFSIFQFATAHHRITAILVATAINIPLIPAVNYVLIQYLGIYGLGLGTAIVEGITFFALWAYCYRDRVFRTCLACHASFSTYCKLALEQLTLGLPIGAMVTIELLFFVMVGLWVGNISTDHLIAHHIAMKWLNYAIITAVSFAEAITILMAKAHAQNNSRSTFKFLWAGVYFTTFCMFVFAGLYWLAPQFLIQLDLGPHNSNPAITSLGITTLAICGIFQIFDGIRIALSGALRGLSDTQYPMWVTLIAFWGIGLPAAYISAFVLNWEHIGLWFGMTCAVIVMTILQYIRIRRLLRDL